MKKIDGYLLISITVLTIFGLFIIYDASSVIAFRDFGDKYYYIKEQFVWAILGFLGMIVFSFFDYHRLYNLAIVFLLGAIGLLFLVFLPGVGIHTLGASRWINLGFTTIQPAEIVKLALAIYLAAWFSHKEKGRFAAFALLVGSVLGLIMLQPDMGTASIILFEAVMLYYLSGASVMHFVVSLPLVGVLGFIAVLLEPYRLSRLTSFLKVSESLNGVSYHVKQILIALGSGGIFGVGVGNSLQKYSYLPENVTDSIFAIIAEEFGFIGSVALMGLLLFVIWRGFLIASQARDTFGKLLAAGIVSFIGIQMVINLGAMTVLLPLTGVPLPFVSYGGSALIIDMISIGILLNISRQRAS